MVCGTHRTNMQALKDVSQVCSELLTTYSPQREYDYKAAQVKLLDWLFQDDGSLMWSFNKDLVTLQRTATLIHRGYETSRQKVFWDRLGILEVQSAIRSLQCQDPRDKIFAVLSLFGDSRRIMPDYTLTSFDLALLVLKEYAACTAAGDIVELAVHLCHNLRPQLNERLEHSNSSTQYRTSVTVDAAIQRKKARHGDAMPSVSTLASAQVTIDRNGQMKAAFELDEVPVPAQITRNRVLVVDERPVALATCELKAGDWIALLSYQSPIEHHFVGLVFRLQQDVVYGIVGEVALCSEWKPSTTWSGFTDGLGLMDRTDFWARFEVLFDPEEVLLLAMRLRESLGALSREGGFSETDTHRLLSTESLTWKRSFTNRREPHPTTD